MAKTSMDPGEEGAREVGGLQAAGNGGPVNDATPGSVFRIWPVFRDDHGPRSVHQEYAFAEQGKRGAAVGLAFEHFDPVDVAFHDA